MNVTERPGHLILNFVSGCKGEGVLYEDDGDNNDYSTVFATTILRQSFKIIKENMSLLLVREFIRTVSMLVHILFASIIRRNL